MVMIDRIIELQQESGLSVRQFEMCIGVKNGSLGSWKKGKYNPGLDAIVGIAKYCHVTTDYLLGLSDNRNVEKTLKPHEQLLVEAFRAADEAGQQNIIFSCQLEKRKAEERRIAQEGPVSG